MIVDIVGSAEAGSEWHDGKFEGKEGELITLVDGGSRDSTFALIRLTEQREDYRVPMKYIREHEAGTGDFAVILSGPDVGERGIVGHDGQGSILENENGVRLLKDCKYAKCLQT